MTGPSMRMFREVDKSVRQTVAVAGTETRLSSPCGQGILMEDAGAYRHLSPIRSGVLSGRGA